jgi:hypothetical protein
MYDSRIMQYRFCWAAAKQDDTSENCSTVNINKE